MILQIKPLDTLFFRKGWSFSAGSDDWTDTFFPPYPSTIYGALRSFLLFEGGTIEEFIENRHKYQSVIGTPSASGSLEIKGPFLSKDENLFFPAPLDLVSLKQRQQDVLLALKLKKKPPLFVSNYPLSEVLLCISDEHVKESQGWLDQAEFIDYLLSQKEAFNPLKDDEFFYPEPKTGIARRSETLVAKEGYLYRVNLFRLKEEVSLVVQVHGTEGIEFPNEGILQLGGEGKAAKFALTERSALDSIEDLSFEFSSGYFKLYFVTPAIFDNGWLPKWIDTKTLTANYNGIELKLVACAVGKHVGIGGWDIAKHTSKPLRKAVPAGSVYYFKILNSPSAETIKETFHLKNISDMNPQEGFGLAIVGEVKL